MWRPLTLVFLTTLIVCPSLRGTDLLPFLVSEVEVERQLLAEDLRLLGAARREQGEALSRFTAAIGAIDETIDGRQVSLEGLEAQEAEAAAAQQALETANDRAAELRRQVHQRLRKTALLESRIESLGDDAGVRIDPLSGRWSLSMSPGNETGFVQLRFSNNEVTGFYTLTEGSSGSLTGTYSGGRLTLQRVDSREGGNSTWTGELDPATRRIRGSWTARDGADDLPSSGTWSAEKLETDRDGSKAP
jgi:hypothetical protein